MRPQRFVRAVAEPLLELRKPMYDFERYSVWLFSWESDRTDAKLEMRDSNPQATFEMDKKRCETFLAERQMLLRKHETEHQQLPLLRVKKGIEHSQLRKARSLRNLSFGIEQYLDSSATKVGLSQPSECERLPSMAAPSLQTWHSGEEQCLDQPPYTRTSSPQVELQHGLFISDA
ncbi:uncharacterized protein LOC109708095 [Ananas comosus]|uniref:Uncharacterized protein LOC109708095 n=1 Tax=Ananas comosus TaxID=4615 RepID=A0A6P5EP63_ANACO|nr:uncharacterized protein LOC109708095 [Ananas comosus]